MIDAILLAAVRKGSERALGQLIDKYTAYVCAIIRNSVGSTVSREDIEEVASDVFLALWENAANIRGNPKAYLGAAARNKAKNKLRGLAPGVPLTEDYAADGGITLEDGLIALDERGAVKSAVLAMKQPDREIFLRRYYGSQGVAAIAEETGLSEAAVKHRLIRGREKLRKTIGAEVLEQ